VLGLHIFTEPDVIRHILIEAARYLQVELPCLLYRNTFGGLMVRRLHGTLFVGSSTDAGLQVEDPTVSRFHCVVHTNGPSANDSNVLARWYVRDLCSLNGTYLNGHRLCRPMRLHDKDCIRLGRTQSFLVVLPIEVAHGVRHQQPITHH